MQRADVAKKVALGCTELTSPLPTPPHPTSQNSGNFPALTPSNPISPTWSVRMKRVFNVLCFLTGLAVLLSAASFCRADGFIVIHNPPPDRRVIGHFAFAPLEVSYHHVSVEINDQVATTTVDQEFYNPNPQQLEGTYLFPLPAGSHI